MIVYFARHGLLAAINSHLTRRNLQGIIQGQLDTPLNAHGRREAQRLSEKLKDVPFAEVHSSDLSRASETAEILALPHGLRVIMSEGLREIYLGSLQGRRRYPGEKYPPDSEPMRDFQTRIVTWLAGFLKSHENTPSSTVVLCVSHGAYLTQLLKILLSPEMNFAPPPTAHLRRHCVNTCVMRVDVAYDGERWSGRVLSWGEADHLHGLIEPPPDQTLADSLEQ